MEQIIFKQLLPNTIKKHFEGKESEKLTVFICKEEGKWQINIKEEQEDKEEPTLGTRISLIN